MHVCIFISIPNYRLLSLYNDLYVCFQLRILFLSPRWNPNRALAIICLEALGYAVEGLDDHVQFSMHEAVCARQTPCTCDMTLFLRTTLVS